MTWTLAPTIRVGFYNNDCIVLDLKNDEYICLMPELGIEFSEFLSNKRNISPESELVQLGWVIKTTENKFFDVDRKISIGLTEMRWHPKRSKFFIQQKIPRFDLFLAAFNLWQVHRILKKHKLYGVIQRLESSTLKCAGRFQKKDIAYLHTTVAQASLLLPVETNCVEGAVALGMMLQAAEIRNVSVCIGCQKYPFYGHCWTEVNGVVVSDTTDVKDILVKLVSIKIT